jgi:hypothetical protein
MTTLAAPIMLMMAKAMMFSAAPGPPMGLRAVC